MKGWTSEELDRVGTAQELQVAALRADGTLRQPVTIWVGSVALRPTQGMLKTQPQLIR